MRQFKNKDYKDIAHYRLNLICKNDPNCNSYMNYEKATDLLSESCKVDTQVFTKICSELDNLYGLSSVEESYISK